MSQGPPLLCICVHRVAEDDKKVEFVVVGELHPKEIFGTPTETAALIATLRLIESRLRELQPTPPAAVAPPTPPEGYA